MGNLLLFGGFLCPPDKSGQAAEGYDAGYQITHPMRRQMEAFRRNENITAAHHRHEEGRDEGY